MPRVEVTLFKMQTDANRCRPNVTTLGTAVQPQPVKSQPKNLYGEPAAHWKCGAGKPVASSNLVPSANVSRYAMQGSVA